MVNFHTAYTAPINPEGVTPPLSVAQVWKGLQRKVRFAQEFVPMIAECEVLEEQDGGRTVIRRMRFKESEEWIRETCVEFEPTKVDFRQENGSTISNVISVGRDGELYMTYVFEWLHPEVEAGSKEASGLEEKYRNVASTAVEKSIESIRRMVSELVI